MFVSVTRDISEEEWLIVSLASVSGSNVPVL